MNIRLVSILLALLFCVNLAAQTNPSEGVVTIGENTSLNEAVQILELSALKFENRKMINLSSFNGAIGIPINSLPWRKAADLIALRNNLLLTEQAGFLAFANPVVQDNKAATPGSLLGVESKQVRINAIALSADRAYLKSLGIDWSTLFNGKVTINADFTGASQVPGSIFGLGLDTNFLVNGTQIEIATLLNAIESNQKGTVIAKPNIIVASGKKGFIQVGQDISVKSVDDAGNTVEKFFATGVILNVEPTVIKVGDSEVVHMKVSIERSSGTPGNVSTVINKTLSETELVLYDGEETVIAGLYDSDKIKTRGGIPILKDLPWWVLGIRYLAGYNKEELKERELVILLKTDIVPNAVERAKAAAANPGYSPVPPEAGGWGYQE